MAIAHFEKDFVRAGAKSRKAPPDARAGQWGYRVGRRAMWILAATLLAAAGFIAFQFLVMVVTLD